MLSGNHAYDEDSGFIDSFCRYFKKIRIISKLLSSNEIDSMFLQIRQALIFIKLEYNHGMKNIPIIHDLQAGLRGILRSLLLNKDNF
jgi:hypothetical protein